MRGGADAEKFFVVFFSELGVAWRWVVSLGEVGGSGGAWGDYRGWSRHCL
jgi:hypothetical protein